MELIINGIPKTLELRTLQEVIEHYELTGKPVIAEVDGQIVDSAAFGETQLQPGMRIELVHFVGGG